MTDKEQKLYQKRKQLEDKIRPLVDAYLEKRSDEVYDVHSFECLCCENSLCFYDDIDPCCIIGFAGQEYLCPILQKEHNITVPDFNLSEELKNEIKELGDA